MTELQWTVSVLGAGLGSYLLRAAPFAWRALRELGRRHLRCLTYISFAVAAGIVSRAIFLSQGDLTFDRDAWFKAVAVLLSVWLYRRTRSMPIALFSAVAAAVAIRALATWAYPL